ncbi:hypothetical protein C2R22_11355 [Salinigranum rubrum]|uniref:Uncharacterized protein n=1 Tax=Salinigranum rubrum TaxID=755307 RepID=A0A2I8VJS9_9EURY|nr:hypothetical protein [Salinigranum rubrum]AUV82171.1 hypothetical protein C2R22_11355 [Salinigranum rubrum]
MLVAPVVRDVTLYDLDPFDSSDGSRARVGGDDACDHPHGDRVYLGQMGTAAFFTCPVCDGVLVEW